MQDVVRGDKAPVETYARGEAENAPLFEVGDRVDLRGVECELVRVNRSTLVFRPLSDEHNRAPWRIVREIT